MTMIPYGRQDVTQDDIDSVTAVLRSDFLTQGAVTPRFEAVVAAYCGAVHAVAVNSATSALHIACLALDLKPGDWLWTTPITFLASANCARYCGADVDFVDIDAGTGNMSPVALEAKLRDAEVNGRLPKIVVPVHLAGQSCDMRAIHALGKRYGFRIIEDASHAIGGSYLGSPVGRCEYSDITVFSFHPVKIITTAEGGLATTNDAGLAARLALFRSHGMTRDLAAMTHESDGGWYYQQIELGYNYRLTELQAALGLSQIERLGEYVDRRNQLASRYDALLADLPLRALKRSPGVRSAYHLYVIRLDTARIARSHGEVFDSLREQGIGVNLHYIPVHTQPYYQQFGAKTGYSDVSFPESLAYYSQAISLPMYATLDEAQQDRVVEAIRQAIAL